MYIKRWRHHITNARELRSFEEKRREEKRREERDREVINQTMNLQASPLHLKEATVTCIPRLRGGGVGRRSRRGGSAAAATQVSVLDRLRDVVLRLAMLSAATTATSTNKQGSTLRRTATMTPSRAEARVTPASATYADSYRSEAVDDCIEFLKRSAAGVSGAGDPPSAAVEATTAASPALHAPPCATLCES